MEKLLVIDDDSKFCEMLETVLALEGYEVISATDGRLGLQLFHGARPGLVIVDLVMPEPDGIEIIRKIREADADVPILATSGVSVGQALLPAAKMLGATRILSKPFGGEELRRTIRALLSREG
jgi:DNA-binding response OmpR family regulator